MKYMISFSPNNLRYSCSGVKAAFIEVYCSVEIHNVKHTLQHWCDVSLVPSLLWGRPHKSLGTRLVWMCEEQESCK